jgi:hypothetical protein
MHVLVWIWGSDYVTSYFCVPLSLLWLFDPISVENSIWGDGKGICWCDADSLRLCPVRRWKPVVSYHTQI